MVSARPCCRGGLRSSISAPILSLWPQSASVYLVLAPHSDFILFYFKAFEEQQVLPVSGGYAPKTTKEAEETGGGGGGSNGSGFLKHLVGGFEDSKRELI